MSQTYLKVNGVVSYLPRHAPPNTSVKYAVGLSLTSSINS